MLITVLMHVSSRRVRVGGRPIHWETYTQDIAEAETIHLLFNIYAYSCC